jgi:hypothetical protein
MADEAPPPPPAEEPKPGRIGRLLQKHPQLVASSVIGFAGLIATSIWQYRQQQTQKTQAEAAQKVAETQAANSLKISRLDVLGKNLNVLAQSGPGTADQRYGVLLSLVRAEIIDPELAVSYALELGKDNAEYMVSVLQNTQNKDYTRLLRGFTLSCEERYGVSPPIDACADKLAQRSQALGELIGEEITTAIAADQPGPLILLKEERRVQLDIAQLVGLFETGVLGMYDRRDWEALNKLESYSTGAHLVASLALAAARTGELATDDEAKTLEQFHAAQSKWLNDYLASKTCDAECKGHLVDVMLTHFAESQGDYDATMRKLLESPRAQSGIAIARLHGRLLWCHVSDSDLQALRDRVLVPAATDLAKGGDPTIRDQVLSLIAVAPEPPSSDAAANAAWNALVAQLEKNATVGKSLREHRSGAQHQRQAPPSSLRKVSFCTVPVPTEPKIQTPPAAGSAAGGSATAR